MRSIMPFILLASGCGVATSLDTFVATNAPPRPMWSKSPNEVAVVSTPPARSFVEIGFVEGLPSGRWDEGPQEVIDRMRVDAARYGCDVLLITGVNQSDRPGQTLGPRMGYHGACLVYPDVVPPPQAASAAAAAKPSEPPALLFRNKEGNVYRVKPEAREQALHAGWVQVGPD